MPFERGRIIGMHEAGIGNRQKIRTSSFNNLENMSRMAGRTATNTTVSMSTIYHRIRSIGLRSYCPNSSLPLTPHHKSNFSDANQGNIGYVNGMISFFLINLGFVYGTPMDVHVCQDLEYNCSLYDEDILV
ncbi:hypothetical protein BDFB_012961 [Asbolus verrucosus]|uniref:Uncharacterized protein n=1 Tax=Asbolus verrucosus TaxID=1661398 RepID=A0A482W4K4_ASBVE|nr:hypothetical protein BDFB_012961 [Asbolus verrucosus]